MTNQDNKIVIGDREFALKPLSFGTLKAIQPHLSLLEQLSVMKRLPNLEEMQAIEDVVIECLKRYENAPDVAFLDEHLTVHNVGEIVQRIFSVSGVETAPPGEASAVR